jgi:hypothetical protein
MSAWLAAFLFTQAVEVPVYARALAPRPWHVRVAIAFAASLFTHPIVWVGVLYFTRGVFDYTMIVTVFEAFAVLAEAAWLRAFKVRRPLAWALLANAASQGLGTLSRAALDWP